MVCVCLLQRLRLTKEKDPSTAHDPGAALREKIIKRAAVEFQDGMYGILLYGHMQASGNGLKPLVF